MLEAWGRRRTGHLSAEREVSLSFFSGDTPSLGGGCPAPGNQAHLAWEEHSAELFTGIKRFSDLGALLFYEPITPSGPCILKANDPSPEAGDWENDSFRET